MTETDPIIPANIELTDVVGLFGGILASQGKYSKYSVSGFTSQYSHFKGVGAYGPKLIFTHSNVAPITNGIGYYLIGNRGLGESREIKGAHHVYDDHNPVWKHPTGCQVCGSYMAMGNEPSDSGNENSEIQIYDVRNTAENGEMQFLLKIPRDGESINGVGMTKESGNTGRYIVAAGDDKVFNVYRSDSSSLSANTKFQKVTPKDGNDKPLTQYGPGFGLVTQEDGQMYLFTMHGHEGTNTIRLYKLTIEGNQFELVYLNLETTMELPKKHVLGFDPGFRWGKGMAITSPTDVQFFATDRDVPTGSFGVVTWQGSNQNNLKVTWSDGIKYGTAQDKKSPGIGVAMDNRNNCIDVHQDGKTGNLLCCVGKINFGDGTVDWSDGTQLVNGAHCSDVAVAMDNSGNCVEVHQDQNNHDQYYTVGTIDFENKAVTWGGTHKDGSGTGVAVAMRDSKEGSKYGDCIKLYNSSSDNVLYYKVGKISFADKTIAWGAAALVYTDKNADGVKVESDCFGVAMDDDGNCVEIHRRKGGNDFFFSVGKVDFEAKTIAWPGTPTVSGHGTYVAVAMSKTGGRCIEVHLGKSESKNTHYYRIADVDFQNKSIVWTDERNYGNGQTLAVAMDDMDRTLEVHKNQNQDQSYYQVGLVSTNTGT